MKSTWRPGCVFGTRAPGTMATPRKATFAPADWSVLNAVELDMNPENGDHRGGA
jgi:hypothetical protein